MAICPTVKIKAKNDQGYVVINESDYTNQELFTGIAEVKKPLSEVATEVFTPKKSKRKFK